MESPISQPTPKLFSPSLLRLAGYGLLILTCLDLGAILLPPRLTDPVWELETMGQIIERIPVPLLAMVLIFFGELQGRGRWERPLLKGLSWMSLVFGLCLLLLVPLGVMNTMRIHGDNVKQMDSQYNQQVEQLTQLEQQVNQASSDQIAAFLRSQGVTPEQTGNQQPKEQVLTELNQTKTELQKRFAEQKTGQRNTLFERSIKWNISAIVAGTLFIYAWKLTGWARGARKRKKATKKVASQA